MAAILAPRKQAILKEFVDKYPPEIQAILSKPAAERNPYEWQMFAKAKAYLEIDDDTAAKTLRGEERKKYQALQEQLKAYAHLYPGDAALGIGMHDISARAPATHILKGGVYENPQEEVPPGFLTILDPKPAPWFRRLV
jgi:hypothetical protein